MKERPDVPIPDALHNSTVCVAEHRDGWMVTIEAEAIGARNLITGADRATALLVGWDAALRWHSHLMIAGNEVEISYVPADHLAEAAAKYFGRVPPAGGR